VQLTKEGIGMILDFNEISDDKKFEDLVVSYFADLKNESEHRINDVEVKPSGTGVDGGRDILVTFKVTDGVTTFERRWVVQCKFHNSDISTDKISDINIPTLIHSYKASGYLLVCKQKPTSKLTDFFERLEINCLFAHKYAIWSGEQFKRLILVKSKREILQQYFPKYFNYCITNKIFEV
jgi:hypothetical protein